MGSTIDHVGIIESIENNHIRVRIDQASACASCQVKSMCASAESKEKTVDVWDAQASRYAVGQRVRVCATLSMGRNAVTLAFLVPLVLMMVWMVAALKLLNLGELPAICGVIVILTVYYMALSLFKNRLSRSFSFWIEE